MDLFSRGLKVANGTLPPTERIALTMITDFDVMKSLNKDLDAKAIEFIKEGPKWIPAREHGHLKQTGWGTVSVEL